MLFTLSFSPLTVSPLLSPSLGQRRMLLRQVRRERCCTLRFPLAPQHPVILVRMSHAVRALRRGSAPTCARWSFAKRECARSLHSVAFGSLVCPPTHTVCVCVSGAPPTFFEGARLCSQTCVFLFRVVPRDHLDRSDILACLGVQGLCCLPEPAIDSLLVNCH